jgi:hypothetical protein
MSEVVKGVDCIALVINYLNPLVTPGVHGRVPNPRPSQFYRISAAGGPGFEDKVNFRAAVTVEAWGPDEPTAMNDLLLAMALLEAAPNEFYAECSAPVSLPDPDTGTPRFLSTVQLAVRGSVLTP